METKTTINITKSAKDLISRLDNSGLYYLNTSETDRFDLFNFALALGIQEGYPTKLNNSEGLFRTERLNPQHKCVYYGIYYDKELKENKDMDKLNNFVDVLHVIEEYANTGFIQLEKYIDEHYDDETLMLKLINTMNRIVDENGL